MTKAFVLAFMLMLMVGTAAEAVAQDAEETHDFGARKRALCFDFSSFSVDKFKGGIGGKLWTSEKFAWVLSVNGEYAHQDAKGPEETTHRELGLICGFEDHHPIVHKLSRYFGASVEFGSSNYERKDESGSKKTTKGSVVGGALHLGVEYWVLPDMSLGAEYGLGLRQIISRCNDCSPSTKETQISAGISTASLILSFYF